MHDQVFLPFVVALEDESIVLADAGFNDAVGIPANLKLGPHRAWNERMLVETPLSLVITARIRSFIVFVPILKPV